MYGGVDGNRPIFGHYRPLLRFSRIYRGAGALLSLSGTANAEVAGRSAPLIPDNPSLVGFAPIFPDTCYHLTHYWPAAADIPVASDNPVHYADAIRYNARTPLQGSLLPLTRLVWA